MSDILYKKFLHKDANFKKLATREDPYHVHKTLGILSVCSFVYRYGYVYVPFEVILQLYLYARQDAFQALYLYLY